jgi:hypothetical protein
MAKKNIGVELREKSLELKKWLVDLNAKMEQWKFSMEDTKEGLRVELHAVALIKHPKDDKK